MRDILNHLFMVFIYPSFLISILCNCNEKPGLHLQQAENSFVLIPQLFCLSKNSQKGLPTAGKILTTAKYVFFIGVAIKTAVSFSNSSVFILMIYNVKYVLAVVCTFYFEGLLFSLI